MKFGEMSALIIGGIGVQPGVGMYNHAGLHEPEKVIMTNTRE
jgi:hypothetical protein